MLAALRQGRHEIFSAIASASRPRCACQARALHSSPRNSAQKAKKPVIPSRLRLASDYTPPLKRTRPSSARSPHQRFRVHDRSTEPKDQYSRQEGQLVRTSKGAPRHRFDARARPQESGKEPAPSSNKVSLNDNRALPARGIERPKDGERFGSSPPATALDPEARTFASPPLSAGLLEMVRGQLGPKAKPTYVQSLSIQHFLLGDVAAGPGRQVAKGKGKAKAVDSEPSSEQIGLAQGRPAGSETLIAAETGSGKTLAYLLPLLQRLKASEGSDQQNVLSSTVSGPTSSLDPDGSIHEALGLEEIDLQPTNLVRPRALILAPTHELARQLAAHAKALCHIDKLRVVCLSSGGWLEQLREDLASTSSEFSSEPSSKSSAADMPLPRRRPAPDIIVATPERLLDVCKARVERAKEAEDRDRLVEAGKKEPNRGMWKEQLVGLDRVQAVVCDEADALFDRDFVSSTRAVLHRVREARDGVEPGTQPSRHQQHTQSAMSSNPSENDVEDADGETKRLPYDLILATATIPRTLSAYLSRNHPSLVRLSSPGLHRLPSTLTPIYVDPANSKHAAVATQLQKVFAEDVNPGKKGPAKVLIFANRVKGVELLSKYLTERGIENVAITGAAESRSMRSNKHLEGFLAPKKERRPATLPSTTSTSEGSADEGDIPNPAPTDPAPTPKREPRVLISTSLLARGLDFSPTLSHVFLPDTGGARVRPDRGDNALELLHRAGRSARAGRVGRVVLFDKAAAGNKSLINRSGRRVGRVRGRIERMVEELRSTKKRSPSRADL